MLKQIEFIEKREVFDDVDSCYFAPDGYPPIIIRLTTIKKHHEFNYAIIKTYYLHNNRERYPTTYECNCSVFHNESSVKSFIDEIRLAP